MASYFHEFVHVEFVGQARTGFMPQVVKPQILNASTCAGTRPGLIKTVCRYPFIKHPSLICRGSDFNASTTLTAHKKASTLLADAKWIVKCHRTLNNGPEYGKYSVKSLD